MKQRERVREEVSIVGMACVLPGHADSLDAFREVVFEGRDVTGPIPSARFGGDGGALPPQARHGGFIARSPWEFDPAVFSIAPKEATYMDPQHRLLLEVCYHAIEDAGIDPASLKGQKCGVFVGLSTLDYARRMSGSDDYNGFLSRGALGSMAAGRISYHFGLEGPSFVVDTACSSSLVAVHQALAALNAGECEIAIVAGASLMLTHDYSVDLAQAGMLAADGRCKPFTLQADGFARGEGVGVMLLMPHDLAARSGKRIYANLLGSAVNSDGRSNGITAPSQRAQRRVIEEALSSAALEPSEIGYVETHGTGTDLGDRIELSALADVFASRHEPLYLGAVKANIGHCEGSAGVASLIKAALCLYERRIAPHCFASDVNEDLPLARFHGVIPSAPMEWQEEVAGKRLVAGVSSFGMSGTNAHVIAGAPPVARTSATALTASGTDKASMLFLSARTVASTVAMAAAYADRLEASPDLDVRALCDAALANRQVWPHSAMGVVGRNAAEFAARLRQRCAAPRSATPIRRVAMVFTGQGCQYANMSRGLFEANERFRNLLRGFARTVDTVTGWDVPLLQRILVDDANTATTSASIVSDQQTSQLSLLALQCALAQFWIELGVKPYAVLGHSVGEYAAAWVAGAFDFESAARMVLSRADAMNRACRATPGKMLSVAAPQEVIRSLIDDVNRASGVRVLWLSALNGPESIVVAGTAPAVLAATELAERHGLVATTLDTQGAFHTPLMHDAAREFADLAARTSVSEETGRPSVRFISSVDGLAGDALTDDLRSPAYWSAQIERPVDFAAAALAMLNEDVDAVLEIGPRPVLCGLVSATARTVGRPVQCLHSLDRRGRDDETFLAAVAQLAEGGALGIRAAMAGFSEEHGTQTFMALPTYPFDRTVLRPPSWPHSVGRSDGHSVNVACGLPQWSEVDFRATLHIDIAGTQFGWIDQHRIHDQPIVPGSFYASTGIALAMQITALAREGGGTAGRTVSLHDLTISRPLVFTAPAVAQDVVCRVSGSKANGRYTIVYRLAEDAAAELARVHFSSRHAANAAEAAAAAAAAAPAPGGGDWQLPDAFYEEYARRGVQYGPMFRRIEAFRRISVTEVVCRIAQPDVPAELPLSHSAFIDTCFQALGVCSGHPASAYAPMAVEAVWFDSWATWRGRRTCRAVLRSATDAVLVGDVFVYDEEGRCVASIETVTCVSIPSHPVAESRLHYRVEWMRHSGLPVPDASELSGETWLLLGQTDAVELAHWRGRLTGKGIASLAIALPHDLDGCVEVLDEGFADAGPIRTVVAWAPPMAGVSRQERYRAAAAFVRHLRQIVEMVSDRSIGQPMQLCLIANETDCASASEILRAATLQAVAAQFRAELPDLDASQLTLTATDDLVIGAIDAIVAIRQETPHIAPQRITTALWRLDGAGLLRYETVAGLPAPDGMDGRVPRPEGRYLVTGAFGGIGRHLVEHLVDTCGCRYLVLTRRGEMTPNHHDHVWLSGLQERSGAHVEVIDADLSDSRIDGAWLAKHIGALDGIFHLAGTTFDRNILETQPAQIDAVLSAKVGGAIALHDYSCTQAPLEFIVYFSSLASLVESPGQISYAIANACLQRLAEHGRTLGLPTTVIDWGPWAGTGMMKHLNGRALSRSLRRLKPLAPEVACNALIDSLAHVRLGAHLAIYGVSGEAATAADATLAVSPTRGAALLTPDAREEAGRVVGSTGEGLFELLTQLIAAETGHAPQDISGTATLEELGLDSVGTIRIRSELQRSLGLSLPASLFFDSRTVSVINDRLLARLHESAAAPAVTPVDAPARAQSSRVPLSYNQFALWYEQIHHRGTHAYNCAIGWRVVGVAPDTQRLLERWRELIGEHELLRATFDEVDHEPGYVVHPSEDAAARCPVVIEDIASPEEADARIKSLLTSTSDLAVEFATRVTLLRVSASESYLVVTSNHLVMDASTIFLVGVQLLEAACGKTTALLKSDAAYRDFVEAQRALDPATIENARELFVQQIIDEDGVPVRVELPVDRVRSENSDQSGGTVRVPVSADLADVLNATPAGRRAASHLTAWLLLLARNSNQSRVMTGVAFNGRSAQRWRRTAGHFVNVLPLVSVLDESLTVSVAIDQVRQSLFELVDYQDIPLALLMRDERLRTASQSAGLLQTYFNFFDAAEMTVDVGAFVDASPLRIDQQEAQFDLSLWVTQSGNDWSIDFKFCYAVFDRATVEQIAHNYTTLLLALLDPDQASRTVASISMLPTEQLSLLESGQGPLPRVMPEVAGGGHERVHELFERCAEQTPDAVAIEWGARRLSYRNLNDLADVVAVGLRAQGVGDEATVGILFPRFGCPESIIAILAIWKCNAAYVALDLKHPAARTGYMIDTAGCAMVLTQMHRLSDEARQALAERDALGVCDIALSASRVAIEYTVERRGDPRHAGRLEPNSGYADRDGRLAYVLFTSGSTGNPKGVLVEHAGLTERLRWMEHHFGFSRHDKFLQGTVLTFDISVPEYSLPLMTGATIVLMDETDGPGGHAAVCARHAVTMMSTVPSLLNLLLEQLTQCPTLRHVISVGEALMQPVVRAWLASGTATTLNNLYGPTEVTIYATHHACTRTPDGPGASIGVACDGVRYWVLDSLGRPVPPGVPGELYLGGSGVARGYIGTVRSPDPFVANPFQDASMRMYRTGDIVKWRRDGELDYIGRNDFRVKLRGLLVELGEIEHVLMSHPGVRHATALVIDVGSGASAGRHIVGCVIAGSFDEDSIFSAARVRLPDYMVPWRLMRFEEFPSNSSGKVDRKALSELVHARMQQEACTRSLPETAETLSPLQSALCALWKAHLDLPSVGTGDNFFQLGGDSLSLTRVVLAAERELGLKVDFGRFVANPTIDGLIVACSSDSAPRVASSNPGMQSDAPYAEDLAAVAQLPAFAGTVKRESAAYLLTGATGHLGAWLLRMLLEETSAEIFVLVRGRSADDARERLESRYRALFKSPLQAARVKICRGDATLPKLGLDEACYASLVNRVTQIIHSAAHVNHAADYTFMREGNVTASRHILAFASAAQVEHLHYISTQYTELPALPEQWLDEAQIGYLSSGYERSKFVAEASFARSALRGYPTSIYRLPLLIAGNDPQLRGQNHFVALSMKCLAMGTYPDAPIAVPILPTENVARYIVRRSKATLVAVVRNAYVGALDFRVIAARLGDGIAPLCVPAREWIECTRRETVESDPFFRMLPLYGDLDGGVSLERPVEHGSYLAELARLEISLPQDRGSWLLDETMACLQQIAHS